MSYYGRWKPYVPVAQRRAQAARQMAALRKRGADIRPVTIEGRKIVDTFWGKGWCTHLESFSDFENRLPRGRTYVRNGSVCHLAIRKGKIEAKVIGSDVYNVHVRIKTLSKPSWKTIKSKCSGKIGSLLELLSGRLSDNIMTVVTDPDAGLFPKPAEIEFDCDCPDYAYMCKHVAAVLYGIGARLDTDPSLLFQLRDVDHNELVASQVAVPAGTGNGKSKRLDGNNLGDVFGIELDAAPLGKESANRSTKKTNSKRKTKASAKKKVKTKITKKTKTSNKKRSAKKPVKKKPVKKKTVKKKATAKKKKTATEKAAKKKVASKAKKVKSAPKRKPMTKMRSAAKKKR